MELVTNISKIRQIMAEIKRCKGDFIHNLFVNDKLLQKFLERRELYCVHSRQSSIFLRRRRAGYQLYLVTANVADLSLLLRRVYDETVGHRLIVDVPGRNAVLEEFLEKNKFRVYSVLQRMSRFSAGQGNFCIPAEFMARENEAEEIEKILQTVFDDVSDQLMNEDSLLEFIKAGRVIVARDEKAHRVASVIIFENIGQMIHWRHWATAAKYRSQHYGRRLFEIYDKYLGNFSRQVLFAHKGNSVIELHEKLGFKFDGFEDSIFIYE